MCVQARASTPYQYLGTSLGRRLHPLLMAVILTEGCGAWLGGASAKRKARWLSNFHWEGHLLLVLISHWLSKLPARG